MLHPPQPRTFYPEDAVDTETLYELTLRDQNFGPTI